MGNRDKLGIGKGEWRAMVGLVRFLFALGIAVDIPQRPSAFGRTFF